MGQIFRVRLKNLLGLNLKFLIHFLCLLAQDLRNFKYPWNDGVAENITISAKSAPSATLG